MCTPMGLCEVDEGEAPLSPRLCVAIPGDEVHHPPQSDSSKLRTVFVVIVAAEEWRDHLHFR